MPPLRSYREVNLLLSAILLFLFCAGSFSFPQACVADSLQSSRDNFIEVDRVRLHYVRSGSGLPLVLLHGNDGTLNDFTMSIFDRLSKHFEVIAFDRPGHGESELLAHKTLTPESQAEIIHAALNKLGIRSRSWLRIPGAAHWH